LGIIAALNRGRWGDRLIMGISLVGYSMPAFFLGLLLVFFVIIKWQFLPFPAYVAPWENPFQFFQTMLLPWILLATLYAAYYIRLTRNQVLEVLGDDYVRTARAKGLPERTVVVKHALRAGLTPIVTSAGLDLAGLLGGAIISENIFSLPGLGALAISSIIDSDLPLITGITILTAAIIIFANLVVDLLYAVVDPRVRVT
jgi:peptide/nickel transport system permease protein